MRQVYSWLGALLLTLRLLTESAGAHQPEPKPAQFLGFLYVQWTSTPIPGATVAFETLGLTATTDADGRFRLARIRPGNQIRTTKKIGFAQFITSDLIDKNQGRSLTDLLAMISGPRIPSDSGHT